MVSFQGDKRSAFYRWFKYKEAFSSGLVRYVINRLTDRVGVLLDPFAGTGCALFAARNLGWNGVGIELLPVGFYAMNVREAAEKVRLQALMDEIKKLRDREAVCEPKPQDWIQHIRITKGAFPQGTEKQLAQWRAYCREKVKSPPLRKLLLFAAFSILEQISYTRKDGQYLRWDSRCPTRKIRSDFQKGEILGFRQALLPKLNMILQDLRSRKEMLPGFGKRPALDISQGSCLELLPTKRDSSVDLVLTSPPYCNRYDYTRTYALELVFLGYDNEQVKKLRQRMLTCTVENKAKLAELESLYTDCGRPEHFDQILETFHSSAALSEVLEALEYHSAAGDLNNPNVIRMVRNYFFESCFVVFELARLLKPGGHVVMVNDNVRYSGEEVPVDLILAEFAEAFGLCAASIWKLPRGKGNSSQQMGNHGRSELRKCAYVWEKK
ncbi:MAG: hypothetical protein ACOC8H_01405 [bacterium]